MTTIRAVTIIDASIKAAFRFSLSIDLELSAAKDYGIRAVGGVTTGSIGRGERVTWKVRQFGVPITHTTEISGFREPSYFQDRMVKGFFRTFTHDHFFSSLSPAKTEMRDEMSFSMPLLLTGKLAELLIVKRRLSVLLTKRNAAIKAAAESQVSGE